MLQVLKQKLPFLTLLVLSVSCSRLPSVDVCTRLSISEGYCVNTITEKDRIINDENLLNGKTWIDIIDESVIVPIDSWMEIKGYFIKECKKSKKCAADVYKWKTKLDSVSSEKQVQN